MLMWCVQCLLLRTDVVIEEAKVAALTEENEVQLLLIYCDVLYPPFVDCPPQFYYWFIAHGVPHRHWGRF